MTTPKQHATPQQAKEEFLEQLEEAETKGHGKWMGVVFCPHPDDPNRVLIYRTTCQFPKVQFDTCVSALSENLQNEIRNSFPNREPLPLADHVRDNQRTSDEEVKEIFGSYDEEEEN